GHQVPIWSRGWENQRPGLTMLGRKQTVRNQCSMQSNAAKHVVARDARNSRLVLCSDTGATGSSSTISGRDAPDFAKTLPELYVSICSNRKNRPAETAVKRLNRYQ